MDEIRERRARIATTAATWHGIERELLVRRIEAYLPGNYEVAVVVERTVTGSQSQVIEVEIRGHDVGGWTLDDYVIPRLASGGIVAVEVGGS